MYGRKFETKIKMKENGKRNEPNRNENCAVKSMVSFTGKEVKFVFVAKGEVGGEAKK